MRTLHLTALTAAALAAAVAATPASASALASPSRAAVGLPSRTPAESARVPAASVGLHALAEDGPTGPWPSTPPTRPPSNSKFGIRLVDVPVDESQDPRAFEHIIDNLAPGTTIHRRIQLSTDYPAPLHVDVYPAAATITGGSFVGAAGHDANELSSWTSVSQDSVDLSTGGTALDTITISVPADAAPGERYAIVWAEVHETTPGSIALVNRVGMRIYLNVGGNNPPASNFVVDSFTAQRDAKNRPEVSAMVDNTGGRALDLSGTVTLSQVNGALTAGPYPVTLGTTLAPGQTEPVHSVLTNQLPNGPWNATIELKSGLLDEKYQARITFPNAPGSAKPAPAHPASSGGHTALITSGLVGSGLLGAAAFPLARRRRRNRSGFGG
ncbi:MAG TPA: hypothetical protein VGX23_18075 [Actinocrinis sp.]|nr:hypothetical protein [Actinocrinis sp.]